LLDAELAPGGAWRHGWNCLRLFSPAQWSSLPGWLMPPAAEGYPTREEVLQYLKAYEERYALPVLRPVRVAAVTREDNGFRVHTNQGEYLAKAVVSATGTWSNPYVPDYPSRELFHGSQVHSAHYERPEPYAGKRVLVVGGGNSGAQILAEVSTVASTCWVTTTPPVFLPDDVDGRVLFERATLRWKARQAGQPDPAPPGGLGDIVMVPPVHDARSRGVLKSRHPFVAMTERGVRWPDGQEEAFDAVIWCTGFRPALQHLAPLGVIESDGLIETEGTRAKRCPGLWLVGYGEWTGYASATLVGVMRSARTTVGSIAQEMAASS
jgi:cation diffusion facilitator CzcD-associated flavoprotein CzcO